MSIAHNVNDALASNALYFLTTIIITQTITNFSLYI